ncbi:hypothetical protein B4110_3856 [Parageobacillus toebii]|uniref:Uncharacterized protein n=1 Tax=Parageobacillus toebii TaxID=153151 RepID=A0A150MCC9_9BACL|nr:hypothetical protein B4110_3856 [Parageobacillus toebii]
MCSFFFERLSFPLVEGARFDNDQPNRMAFIHRCRFPYPIRGAVFLRQRKWIAPRRVPGIGFGQRGFHDPERRRASGDQKGVRRFRLRQRVLRHRGGICHVNPFVLDLRLLQLLMDTGQHLGIPRFVRQVAVVHISIKRNAILVADQSEADLLLPTVLSVVAMGNMQGIRRGRFIRAVNRYIGRIGMEHPKGDAFLLVDLHKASRNDLMDVGIIQAIQMAGDGIVIEPRRLELRPDQLGQIDFMRPSFQMNQRLTAA